MHIHNKVFNAGQRNIFRFLSYFKWVETRGSFLFFLFVLAIEAFGCLLKRAKEGGYVSSFRVTFIEDYRCGKDNIFPNEGGLHRLEVLRRASQSITCLCL